MWYTNENDKSILPYSLYKMKKMISKIYTYLYFLLHKHYLTFNHKIPIVSLFVSRQIRPIPNETLFYSKRSMMDPDNGPLSESDMTYVQSVVSWKVLTST